VFADPPVLCGHRGSGKGPGENTLESFRAAVRAGLPWVEVDARLSADGVLVARHDPALADGRAVAQLTAQESGLMRLEELFAELPPHVGVDIDLKSALEDAERQRERTTAAAVGDFARRAGGRPLLVSSFDPAALLIVRERAPGVPLGLLTWRRFPLRKAIPAAVHLGLQALCAQVESFGVRSGPVPNERPAAESVAVAHRAGLAVVAWCARPDEEAPLVEAGVDCLVIDDVLARTRP
jgi:glycerophosphoryl diester phosphodiesterase